MRKERINKMSDMRSKIMYNLFVRYVPTIIAAFIVSASIVLSIVAYG